MAPGDVMHRISLQARLLVLLSLLLAILWVGLSLTVRRDAAAQATRDLEGQLHATADLLLVVARAGVDGPAGREILARAGRASPVDAFARPVFELRRDGRAILRSDPFPDFDSRPPPGLSIIPGNTGNWIVFTVVEGTTTRRAAVPETARADRAARLRGDLSGPWTLILPVFAIAVLGAVWIGLRPLREIERRVDAVDPGNPMPIDTDIRRLPRELATLTGTFNGMVTRLARVLSDRRIFASVASHELRTPLAGALIQLEVLERAPDGAAARRKLAEALSYMDRLVTQLLFLARADGAAAEAGPKAFDIAALAGEVAAEAPGEVEVSLPDGPVSVTGHSDLIGVLLRNLVRNARAAAEGQAVLMNLEARADEVEIGVFDRGPGVPEADREAVFDPFRRGRQTVGGTGLGLTVARRIAELHGGGITIADREGGGAAIRVVLRRVPPETGG